MKDKVDIKLTEEEIKAIKDYTGYQHTAINMVGNLNYKKLQENIEAGWKMPEKKEELKVLIDKFINIYSAIYKRGENSALGTIYRGATKGELGDFKKNEKTNKILSTSCSENIAKTFLPYGEGGLLRISTTNKIKRLYIEPYRDKDRKNEQEILIQPFCTIKESEFVSKWDGINYYNVSLDREKLPDISNEEIEELEEKSLENFGKYLENVKEYNEIEKENEFLYFQLKNPGVDRKEWLEQDEKIRIKLSNVTKKLEEYQNELLKMVKGKCRQKEILIDKEKEEIIKEQEERKIQEENKRLAELKEKVREKREYITNNLDTNWKKLQNILYNNQTLSEKLGVEITQYSMDFYKEIVEKIKNEIQESKEESKGKVNEENDENEKKEDIYLKLQEQEFQLKQIEKILSEMPEIIQMQEREQIAEIKSKLNEKVNNIIYQVKLKNLQLKKQEIRKSKNFVNWKAIWKTKITTSKNRKYRI